jgi:quinone-modifying oxidoreductase subunit QmoC
MPMFQGREIEPDLTFIRSLKGAGGDTLKKCFQCATCSVVCNLSPDDKPFPRKEMILASWGQREELIRDPDIWLCYQCNDCTTYCPRGARPGDVLAAVRAHVYQRFSFPSFMGKALASPKALPLLLLVPAVILLLCIAAFAPRAADGAFLFLQGDLVDFNIFLPHSSVDALFVFGNILIFAFAIVGFLRFWKLLQSRGEKNRVSFARALLPTIREIIYHSRFRKCDANYARSLAHMFLLFGFVGAMVTTGAVFLFIFAPHYLQLLGLESLHPFFQLPIDLPHPVKILGGLSGLGVVIGGGILLFRRWTRKDETGANGYVDQLFLYMLFGAGLTGMFSWLIRLTEVSMLAYGIYFLHLLFVFFLLWYMPYSKFAHMIYRTLALVYARGTGRIEG